MPHEEVSRGLLTPPNEFLDIDVRRPSGMTRRSNFSIVLVWPPGLPSRLLTSSLT